MKYLLTIVVLLIACSNPADVIEPDPIEYSILYEFSSEGGVMAYVTYYSPETDKTQISGTNGEYWQSLEMIAHSNQTLWITVTSAEDVTAFIYVDGEIVATSATADSVYVEFTLI